LEVAAQRDAATPLQRAILPDWSPPFDGDALGWCHEAGSDVSVSVGGDWYAFVPISGTTLGVAIGDVAGHGISAVRHMAEYRYALRTLAGEGRPPSNVLTRVHETIRHYPGMRLSSCTYGQIDVTDGTWTYCSAGHLPPLLVRSGEVTVLPSPHGPPLGALPGSFAYSSTTIEVRPGDVIVLYTDGLVERRDQDIDSGISRLARHLAGMGPEDELFAASQHMVQQMTTGSPTADDIALVLLRFSAARTPDDAGDRQETSSPATA
jgi:serine phosphatase RsbU (regulator of sigma subunit)